MIGDVIEQRFAVHYHIHHVPRRLHQLGCSVRRPRKRLARTDVEAQAYWLRVRLPAIKKKARACRGVVRNSSRSILSSRNCFFEIFLPVG